MFLNNYSAHPAYAQRRAARHQTYGELDALADDLEYRASLARQAARRQSVATSPVPRYLPRDAAYPAAAPAYEYASQYARQPYCEPEYYHHPRAQRRAFYQPEPEPVYDDVSYEYEYEPEYEYAYERPAPRQAPPRSRAEFYEDVPELEVVPRPVIRRRPGPVAASRPAARPRSLIAYHQPPGYVLAEAEEAPSPAPIRVGRQQQPQPPRRAQRPIASNPQPQPQRTEAHPVEVLLQQLLGGANAQPQPERLPPHPRRRTVPTPEPQPQSYPTPADVEGILRQLFGGVVPEQPVSAPAPAPARAQRPEPEAATPSMEGILNQIMGLVNQQQAQAPAPAPVPAPQSTQQEPTIEDFLRQMFGTMTQQQQANAQAPDSATAKSHLQQMWDGRFQVPHPTRPMAPAPAEPQTQQKPQTAAAATPAQASTPAAAQPKKPTYTFALPASAQLDAIPTRASPSLPVPGRTFSHLAQNPHDAESSRNQVQGNRGAADEVADIKEAIRRSLDRTHDAKPEAPAKPVATAAPSAPAAPNSEVPPTAPARASSPTPSHTGPASETAMAAIDFIEERFVNLSYEFKFPSAPDFSTSSPSSASASSALLYTPTNAPIRAYEHALTSLLTDLDAVESGGDEEVRHARKELVRRVEHALEELDQEKEAAWKRFNGSSPASESVSAPAPVTTLEEEAGKVVEAEGYVIPEVAQPEPESESTQSDKVDTADSPAAEVPVQVEVEAEAADEDVEELPAPETAVDTKDAEEKPANIAPSSEEVVVEAVATEAVPSFEKPQEDLQPESDDTSEPITSSYPPVASPSSYPPAPARPSSFPPSPTTASHDLHNLATVEADEGQTIDSLGSSPVDIPSELDSDSDGEAEAHAEDLQQHNDDTDNDVPPSMEESQLLEKKTEFVLL